MEGATIWEKITSFLLAIVTPLAVRVMGALGFGKVTYEGADYGVGQAEAYIQGNLSGLPSDMYQIAVMAGFDEGLKIVFAAFTAMIALKVAMGFFSRFSPLGAVAAS